MPNYARRGANTITATRRRISKTVIAFGLFTVLLLYNLFNLQFINHAYYQSKVYEQITTSSSLKAKRGSIYDSNMNLLATDKTAWRIFVSSREIKKQTKLNGKDYTTLISDGLADILSLESSSVYKRISNSNQLDITVKKSADEEEYAKTLEFIQSQDLHGMVFTEAQTTRYYPEETLAAHTLGFVGSDLQGLYGLEYQYNSILSGSDGYYLYAKDANGNTLPTEYATYVPATDGNSIVTTIDSFVQKELENQLEAIRVNHGVENRACGIVMDTETGAILAMATSSPFNPNNPYELDAQSAAELKASGYIEGSEEYKALKKQLLEVMWSNKAVSETYEPGSTFKIVTVSAALDSGAASVNDRFSCHGYLTVGGWHIRCHKAGGHGSGFDLAYGLQMSCNPTMMTIAERVGKERFYDYVEAFGYLEKTGIDLPSEASSIFHKEENIGTTELATASFGQRFKVSVIRQLTSVASVANGGKLVVPYLVEKVIDSEGNIVTEHEATVKRQVVSEEVANTVARILEEGVSGDGGAKNARVDGYKIAAKTGTSQKFDVLDANGNSYLRISSTVGFSLSEDGGIAVIIMVDEPTSAIKYGSVVAAPYVSALYSSALPYLGYVSNAEDNHLSIDNYVGMNLEDAKKAIKKAGLKYEVIGNGNTVVKQTPEENERLLAQSGTVLLYTEESNEKYVEVPDLVGLEASRANKLLIDSGLNIRIMPGYIESGGAKITAQSIAAGSVVEKNTVIEVNITHMDFED